MALFVFNTRNNVKFTIGYQKCDSCSFMKACVYTEPDSVPVCHDCMKSAFESFNRINKSSSPGKAAPKVHTNEAGKGPKEY